MHESMTSAALKSLKASQISNGGMGRVNGPYPTRVKCFVDESRFEDRNLVHYRHSCIGP